MIQIRQGVFETNSSSTHSIVIPKKTDKTAQYIEFHIGEYGWENEKVLDTPSYLYTAILYTETKDGAVEKIQRIKDVLNAHGIGYSFEKPKYDNRYYDYEYLDNGYIDHGNELCDFIDTILDDEDMLLRYLFDGVVYTGNDNQDEQPAGCNIASDGYWKYYKDGDDWKEKWVDNPYHDEDNYDYFYKGN